MRQECHRGHKMTPRNTSIHGKCLRCKVITETARRSQTRARGRIDAQPVIDFVLRQQALLSSDNDPSGIEAVCKILDWSPRRLRSFCQQKGMKFDTADKIVTKLDVFSWFDDEDLRKVYYSVDLDLVDGVKKLKTPTTNTRQRSRAWLSERLGVSTAAVSYALRGKKGVSEETREYIVAAAEMLGVK